MIPVKTMQWTDFFPDDPSITGGKWLPVMIRMAETLAEFDIGSHTSSDWRLHEAPFPVLKLTLRDAPKRETFPHEDGEWSLIVYATEDELRRAIKMMVFA